MYELAIRRPRFTIVAALAITVCAAAGLPRLTLRTDGHALVPPHAPEVLTDQRVRDDFGIEDQLVVMIESTHRDGIYNPHTLQLVDRIARAIRLVDGVHAATLSSLSTERLDRVRTGSLQFKTMLEDNPSTEAQFNQLREDLRQIELYNGTLVSIDARSTAIFAGVKPGVDRAALFARVQRIVADEGDIPERVHVIGAPVAEALLGRHILADLGVPTNLLGVDVAVNDARADDAFAPWLDQVRFWIARHVGLVPIAIAIMALVFLICFRGTWAMLLPLMEVGAAIVFVFGVMGWFGVPVYLTTTILPIILTATGVTDEVHIFSRYRELSRQQPHRDHVEVLRQTLKEMGAPVIKSGITTAAGFLSFALSPIEPVSTFGLFASLGMIFCLLWSVLVIPAQLALLGRRTFGARAIAATAASNPIAERMSPMHRLGRTVVARRVPILMISLLLVALAPFGVKRLIVQDSWIDGFSESSAFHRGTQAFNDGFLGAHILQVCAATSDQPINGVIASEDIDHQTLTIPGALAADPASLVGWWIELRREGDKRPPETFLMPEEPRIKWTSRIERAERVDDRITLYGARKDGSPKFTLKVQPDERFDLQLTRRSLLLADELQRLADLDAFITSKSEFAVGGVLGPADYLATSNYLVQARQAGERRLPADPVLAADRWRWYKALRGPERLKQVVDEHYSRGILTVFLKNANFVDTGKLLAAIRQFEAEKLAPHGISLTFAGDVAVSQTLIDAIVRTQKWSLLGSIIGTLIVTTLLGRSLVWGLYCVIPCAFAVLINCALMGWIGMPLGVATSMFAAMTVGIGDDFAIHLLERCRHGRAAGLSLDAALAGAVGVTGAAIAVDALAVALGFGVMMLSQVPPNARLGGLVVLSLACCVTATLLIMPALLRVLPPKSLREARTSVGQSS